MQKPTVGAVILIGSSGNTPQELVVARAAQASVLDLVSNLAKQGIRPVVVAGPNLDWLPGDINVIRDADAAPFHFGGRLANLIQRFGLSPVIYFGAASAPLLPVDGVGKLRDDLLHAVSRDRLGTCSRVAVTNNLHSSDWIGISHALDVLPMIRQVGRDNSLAWMLQENECFDVRVLPGMRPASSLDLDTPADLAIVRRHGDCPPHLSRALEDSLLDRVPLDAVLRVATRDGSRLALIGRVSPLAWQALSHVTQCWIRVFSEERGMVASERLLRGEVRSLVGRLLELVGPDRFFHELAQVADAAIIDSRVLMAASGRYPDDADRFASDLFLLESIGDLWVRKLTEAAARAPIPVLLGGHSVVAGGLHALTEIIAAERG